MNLKEEGYQSAGSKWWTGRKDRHHPGSYFHEIVNCIDLEDTALPALGEKERGVGILGYCCDEGVRRNKGRIGAAQGPRAIRGMLASAAAHLPAGTKVYDVGDFLCLDRDMEGAQERIGEQVCKLLSNDYFPILLGGGHDIAYGHYLGIKRFLAQRSTSQRLGIINFDAHFDLRAANEGFHSGTPFLQIAQDLKRNRRDFHYLCLGIQRDANIASLFETAQNLRVDYVLAEDVNIANINALEEQLNKFISSIDCVYLSIDLDGFSSAYAPGVSAPSPCGFSPDVAFAVISRILAAEKLLSLDIAELNPTYDEDNSTARLAARLISWVIKKL